MSDIKIANCVKRFSSDGFDFIETEIEVDQTSEIKQRTFESKETGILITRLLDKIGDKNSKYAWKVCC